MKRLYRVLCALLLLMIMISLTACGGSTTAKTYDKAQKALTKGEYGKAAELFENISSYEDSSKMAMYSKALLYGEQKNYTKAIETLSFLGDFKDSIQLVTYYSICLQSESSSIGDVLSAAEQFDAISAFRDSANKAEECRQFVYNNAVTQFNNGDYEKAITIFKKLGPYKDSESQILVCETAQAEKENAETYATAEKLFKAKDYDEAITLFLSLGNYRNSEERVEEVRTIRNEEIYPKAESLFANQNYEEALQEYSKVNSYLDSEEKIIECCKQLYPSEKYFFNALYVFAKTDDEDGIQKVLKDFCNQYSVGNILECFIYDDHFAIVHETKEGYEFSSCFDFVVGFLIPRISVKGEYDKNEGYQRLFNEMVSEYRKDALYVFDFRPHADTAKGESAVTQPELSLTYYATEDPTISQLLFGDISFSVPTNWDEGTVDNSMLTIKISNPLSLFWVQLWDLGVEVPDSYLESEDYKENAKQLISQYVTEYTNLHVTQIGGQKAYIADCSRIQDSDTLYGKIAFLIKGRNYYCFYILENKNLSDDLSEAFNKIIESVSFTS